MLWHVHHRIVMSNPTEWSNETKQLIAATVGKGLNKEALLHLQHVSLTKGLDPLANEIYAIPKGSKVTLIVSIGGMLKLCSAQLDGCETVWIDDQGQAHSVWLPDAPPAACQVSVFRKGASRPFTAACRFSDYNAGQGMWRKMPARMIEKCTTAAALRLAFSDLLSGLYAQEELDQAGMAPPIQMQQDPVGNAGTRRTTKKQDSSAAQATAAVAKAFDGEVVAPAPAENKGKPSPQSAAEQQSDSEQPSALDQIRNTPEHDPGADLLPDREDLPGAVGALYRKAQSVGLTRQGWHTMVQILGGDPIDPSKAMAAVKGLADQAKVDALNAGRNPSAVQSAA